MTRACRIVVADDYQDTAESLAMLLRLTGHQVFVAETGTEALALIERERPEIALVDIGMPELDGYQIARAVRSQSWGEDICLIAITGYGTAMDRAAALDAGFDEHWRKPIDLAALDELIGEPCGRRTAAT